MGELGRRLVSSPEDFGGHVRSLARALYSDARVCGVSVSLDTMVSGMVEVSVGMTPPPNASGFAVSTRCGTAGFIRVGRTLHVSGGAPDDLDAAAEVAASMLALCISGMEARREISAQKASLSAVQVASEALGSILEEDRLYRTVLILVLELLGSGSAVIFSENGEVKASFGFDGREDVLEALKAHDLGGKRSWRSELSGGWMVGALIGSCGGRIFLYRERKPYGASEENTLKLVSRQLARAQERSRLKATIDNSTLEITESLAAALESRDGMTGSHISRTQDYVESVARRIGLTADDVRKARFAAVLHDIGKIAVPDAILNKPGRLSEREWEIMRQHPRRGARIISGISGFERVVKAVLHHHERFDGGGYPDGISGREIPLEARIISVVDSYDAMTSDRPYRKALPRSEAERELISEAGKQFDPEVVGVMIELLREKQEREEG